MIIGRKIKNRNGTFECRKLAHISLVRSTLEYCSFVLDPYLQQDINAIEEVQRHAARIIINCCCFDSQNDVPQVAHNE